jgi:apolipoprotein N-acyltransferase
MSLDPYIWLVLGGLLSAFISGRWVIAAAGWLAPLFLLHYAHAVPLWPALLGLWLAMALAMGISNWRVIPVPVFLYPLVVAAIAAPMLLPFLADRWLTPALPGFAATLVFPLAWTTMEYLGARGSPFGTWGSLAYSQVGNRPLVQLAAFTGLWGIIFMLTWFASVANAVWEGGFSAAAARTHLPVFGALLAAVLLSGAGRLRRAAQATRLVTVATVGWPEGILEVGRMMRVFAPDLGTDEHAALRADFARIHEHFIEQTGMAARAGAKIVVWPEANVMVFAEDEPALRQRLQALARERGIYLLAGIAPLDLAAGRPFENTAVLFGPDGAIAARYTKTTAVPGFEAKFGVRGAGRLPLVDTPQGRITTAICYDLDFPWLLRQAGQGRVDLLLAPASDWREIGALHHHAALFRAVENGVTLVRATRWGWSAVVDAYGRTHALLDSFASNGSLLIAAAPSAAKRTLYARVGDAWAWLGAAGLLGLVSWALVRGAGAA